MKFATLNNGARDGQLVLVSRDLTQQTRLDHVAPTMQYLLENWSDIAPELEILYQQLCRKEIETSSVFEPAKAMAPLPRAYQWCDGSAFLNHGVLLQKAFNLPPQENYYTVPLMYQGASDAFIGPEEPVYLPGESHDIDFEGEFAVFLDEVPMGCDAEKALSAIRLIGLVNDVSLRKYIGQEMQSGFGFMHAKPSSSFAPVVVTPDELGDAWKDGKVCLPLHIEWNKQWFGDANGSEMDFNFGRLIAHAAFNRTLSAGTIIGSGTVSNIDSLKGSSCIAERRALDMLEFGEIKTGFMRFGDHIRMEAFNQSGESLFGAINQTIQQGGPNHE
ncbi:Ureidoglycolate lyase [Vibrio aerogenes CECT 7868]|uniref:Ureidoglycolate lyase n=1 Tax=Vibrio aerogenes CECT 7868 TaxID=1216006 RepID=A0A1M6CJD0_9VIBR|nr:fumarylacetoacetate hydrolase family protein [Vibrio aerogenes]SHI61089.1 Ureidoglycolate lyase [Vibrio aerogenes CECT 7868]